mgnify:FL=1
MLLLGFYLECHKIVIFLTYPTLSFVEISTTSNEFLSYHSLPPEVLEHTFAYILVYIYLQTNILHNLILLL